MRWSPVRRSLTVAAACAALVGGGAIAAAAAPPAPSPTPTAPSSAPLGPTVAVPGTPPIPPDVKAGSFVIADEATGAILAERAPHDRLRPASTLKVLTALALMPRLDPAAVHLSVPGDIASLATAEPGASAVGIKPGLSYRVSDLWNAVFLRSGNDAIATLAAMAGGAGPTVDLMRQTAQRLHANDTVVVNADGYDADGQVSSAYDLALMARAGLQDPGFRAYCSLQKAKFPSVNGTTFEIDNENRLLGKYPGMIGVKNGYTSLAHHTFVGAAERNGRTLVVSVFDAGTDIYQQTAKLLDWGFAVPATAAGVDQLVPADPLQKSTAPDETLPPPDAQHAKKRDLLDGYSGSGSGGDLQTSAAAAASPHKSGGSGSSFVGDAFETLLYVLGFLVFAVVALRARVLWKQRKER
ncbi:Serine-type D-Ala-D-Ala carboxypeptidase [Catenulispora acidiphila DSM 44928]|uniref:Serine-type D-Ala-D-Ala carboxypeptidase n=1 Tax=Catenulispora acidiphila (strain DSM 44928 / JCM 14897 / NBRC 102108 / NRRL B-24433 / ID139908) TaxID=479433 RepID=C7PX25_CATAD|nr:D-alanyl-D-alanine carboxypeptidase [Catenulispora acidiphila]ACU77282.1 Serine-type D-Ala-D-Ala carboxypeptidase [Catenulispora acidiphila DSM 44928]